VDFTKGLRTKTSSSLFVFFFSLVIFVRNFSLSSLINPLEKKPNIEQNIQGEGEK